MPNSTTTLRRWWADWRCNGAKLESQPVLGANRTVAKGSADAYKALTMALDATGYRAEGWGTYNCRKIAGTNSWSLHSYGIAIDIDPFSLGNPAWRKLSSTPIDWSRIKITAEQVEAVVDVRTNLGKQVWAWGGYWATYVDSMHFQIDCSPQDLATGIDWETVPGKEDDEMGYFAKYGDGMPPQVPSKWVMWWQERLERAGVDPGEKDGKYGDKFAAGFAQVIGIDVPVKEITPDKAERFEVFWTRKIVDSRADKVIRQHERQLHKVTTAEEITEEP
jgi:hypothetical protein